MAAIGNITVKKADGTTDVVYNAAVGSAGDRSPAVWTQDAYSSVQAHRPRLEMITDDNGSKTLRRVKFKFSYPTLVTVNGVETSTQFCGFEGSMFNPKGMTTTEWKEAFAQLGNLLCSAAVRSANETGYAPT